MEGALDLRKRKRMLSNRESARRSRMRKRQKSEDLAKLAEQLREANRRISSQLRVISDSCGRVQAENRVIRTQAMELQERLRSVRSLLRTMDAANAMAGISDQVVNYRIERVLNPWGVADEIADQVVNPWQINFPAMPIAASADVFQW